MNANFSKLILKLMEDNNLSKELVLKRINKTSKEFDEMLISDNLTYSDIYNNYESNFRNSSWFKHFRKMFTR